MLGTLAQAQESTADGLEEEFELLREEEVVLSAAKHEQAIHESPSAITVITRDQIENTFCNTLTCLLRFVPEMDIKHFRPNQTTVGARSWSGEDRVLLLVDGLELNSEIFGYPYWEALNVHLEDIERVEVIRGPGSSLYGANAHSAVVSVTTRMPTSNSIDAFLGSGEHDRSLLYFRLNQFLGNWRMQLSGSYDTAGASQTLARREGTNRRLRFHLDRQGPSSSSSLDASLVLFSGVFKTNTVPFDLRDTPWANVLLSHRAGPWQGKLSFSFIDPTLSTDLFIRYNGQELGQYPETNSFIATVLNAELQTDWEPFLGNLLILGGNYRWSTFLSDNILPASLHQHRLGFFIHDEQRIYDRLVITGGLRADFNSLTPFTLSPRLAGVLRVSEDQHLRVSLGRAFRKPSIYESSLHPKGVTGIAGIEQFFERTSGNEHLKNEEITSFEIGYLGRFLENRLTVESNLFFNLYRNTINFVIDLKTNSLGFPDLEKSSMQYRNEGVETNTLGGSLAITLRPTDALRLQINYALRYSYFIAAAPYTQGSSDFQEKGDRLPWEPMHLFRLQLSHTPNAGLRWGAGLLGDSSSRHPLSSDGTPFGDFPLADVPGFLNLSGYVAWRIQFEQAWFETGIRANNALNSPFRNSSGKVLPNGTIYGAEAVNRSLFFYLRSSI